MLHLAIMKERPEVKSVVHCHPPHATAFGIAREPIPQCVLPEVEIFLGDVPITKYAIPGGKEFADTILPFVAQDERHHPGQPRHGELRRDGGEGLLVDRGPRRLLPHADARPRTGPRELLHRARGPGPAGAEGEVGLQGPAAGDEELRVLRNDVFRDSWKETGVEPKAFTPPTYRARRSGAGGDAPSRRP